MTVFEGPHVLKVPVCRRAAYEICFEQYGEWTFAHANILGKWTPAIKRQFAQDVDTLTALHGGPILIWAADSNKKLQKFGHQFGFKPCATLPGGILIMEKKNKNNGKPFRGRNSADE